jgi:putative RNA 2'-phosphotransferase
MDKQKNEIMSKFFSYVLRHDPKKIHLDMDIGGWISIKQLIDNSLKYADRDFTVEDVFHVVETNAKKRFDISEDKTKIRANQGHSIEIYLDLPAVCPPEFLYHGTAKRFLPSIEKEGLKPMERHDVHLSFDVKTAKAVGERHGKPVVLKIKAIEMYNQGYVFKCTKNNVWLTQHVPPKFFEIN